MPPLFSFKHRFHPAIAGLAVFFCIAGAFAWKNYRAGRSVFYYIPSPQKNIGGFLSRCMEALRSGNASAFFDLLSEHGKSSCINRIHLDSNRKDETGPADNAHILFDAADLWPARFGSVQWEYLEIIPENDWRHARVLLTLHHPDGNREEYLLLLTRNSSGRWELDTPDIAFP